MITWNITELSATVRVGITSLFLLIFGCGDELFAAGRDTKQDHDLSEKSSRSRLKMAASTHDDLSDDELRTGVINVERTVRRIEKTSETIRKQLSRDPNLTRVLLLGKTGIGKSTLGNALIGNELVGRKDGLRWFIDLPNAEALGRNSFKTSAGRLSSTIVPQNVRIGELILWDLPGFFDNRGHGQEIVNAFSIDQMFEAPSKVKCVLILSEADLLDPRLESLERMLDKLLTIIPEKSELLRGLSVVVGNHKDLDISARDYLTDVLRRLNEGGASESHRYLLNGLVTRAGGIYSFPACRREGVYSTFTDRIEMLRDLEERSPLVNPGHHVVFPPAVVLSIAKVLVEHADIGGILRQMTTRIRQELESDELDVLNQWHVLFDQLMQMYSDNGEEAASLMVQALANRVKEVPSLKSNLKSVLKKLDGNIHYIKFSERVAPSLRSSNVPIPTIGLQLNMLIENLQHEVVGLERYKQKMMDLQADLDQRIVDEEVTRKRIDDMEHDLRDVKKTVTDNTEKQCDDLDEERNKTYAPGYWEGVWDNICTIASSAAEGLLKLGSTVLLSGIAKLHLK